MAELRQRRKRRNGQRIGRTSIDASLVEPPLLQRAAHVARQRFATTFNVDLRSLALFRALLGGTLFVQLCLWLGGTTAFLSDAGVLPRATLSGARSMWRISLHAASGQAGFEFALLVLALAAAAALCLGWRTRLAAIVSFVLYVSLLNRAPQLVVGGDMLLAALLLWCCFLPVHAHWSLDFALGSDAPECHTAVPNPQRSWAGTALLIQGATACLLTTWLAAHADPFGQVLAQPAYLTPTGMWLAQHGLLAAWIHLAVRWIGGFAPLLLFTPVFREVLRPLAWIALVALQLAAIATFNLGPAPWVALVALSAFVGTGVWRRLQTATSRHPPLRLYHDRQRPESRRWQKLWCTLLVLPRTHLHAAQNEARTTTLLAANDTWILIDADDRAHLGSAAWIALLRTSPLFGPLGMLLAATHAETPLDWLRRRLRRIRPLHLPHPHISTYTLGSTADRAAGVLLVLLVAWTLGTAGLLPQAVNGALNPPLRLLRLDQHWAHYLPRGPALRGWLAALGTTAAGTRVNAVNGSHFINFNTSAELASRQGNIRWHTWHDALLTADTATRARYAGYLCQRWNRHATTAHQLRTLDLVYIVEDTPGTNNSLNAPDTLEQRVLWSGTCRHGRPDRAVSRNNPRNLPSSNQAIASDPGRG